MPNYEDCVIYTIRSGEHLYVGSTCNFVRRKFEHKSCIHNEKSKKHNFNLYKTIRENDGKWEMKPYSVFPCKNKMEMNVEEERVRRELNADLNSYSCCGQNKELYAEHQKQYREKNIEYYKEYMNQYRIDNKERLNEYNNKRNKERYAKNKVIISQKYKEKRTCECGCIIAYGAMYKHKKTNKHLKLLEEKQENINMEFDN